MIRVVRGLEILVLGFMVVLLVATAAAAAPVSQEAAPRCLFDPGAVIRLAGTPHLFIVDQQRVLHWGGDTRGLAGRPIDWNSRCDVGLQTLRGANRGDPWLSSGLPKLGEPIYLSKWEDTEPAPTLLHIQSIPDVELFGINTANYGRFVLDRLTWQELYGFDPGWLRVGPLASAASYAWSEADRAAYGQLLENMENVLSAHLYRANQSGIDAGVVLPGLAACERSGLDDFERNRNPGYALAVTQECLARLIAGGPGGPGPITSVPRTPANVRVAAISPTEVRVSWDDVPDETGFRIYGGDPQTPPTTLVASVPLNITAFTVAGLIPATTYCYSVLAFNPIGESPAARPVCAATSAAGAVPTAPSNLLVAQVPTGTGVFALRLDWTDTSANETGFQIWRGDQMLATVGPNVTTYTDNGWSPNVTSCYRVLAVNPAGQAASPQACLGGLGSVPQPTPPTNVRLSPAVGLTGIRVDWSDTSSNEDGFRVLRNGSTIATVASNVSTYADFNFNAGVVNCYRIVAFNSVGEAPSGEACQFP